MNNLLENFINRCLFYISKYNLPIPLGKNLKWKSGIISEINFWDSYFKTKGLQWKDSYGKRMDPNLPLQERPATLLPEQESISILDVGAGPLTFLGKTHPNKKIKITAVDPLADQYARIMKKYGVQAPVVTEKLSAEEVRDSFSSNTFDLAYARNCLDHALNPEDSILQMIEVVKKNGYVLLEHRENEAETEEYSGFHQWNFTMLGNGDFIIGTKNETVNFSKKYSNIASVVCERFSGVDVDGDWLITRIHKF